MAFDNLKPQPPRTSANTRYPEPAIAYGVEALARSREAVRRCRTVLDVAFGPDEDQRLDLYLPDDAKARDVPVILFFHGGAWMHGYKEWAGFMAPALVDTPAIFVSAGYRLAPEHKFPAPLDDAFAALQWINRNIAGQVEIELLVLVRPKGDIEHGSTTPNRLARSGQRLDAVCDRGLGIARVGAGPGRLRFQIVERHEMSACSVRTE